MLTLLKSLTNEYNPRIYVHADTDHGSLKKIKSLEIENENNFEVRFGIGNMSVIQRAFPRTSLIGYQTIAFILSFFRNIITCMKKRRMTQMTQMIFQLKLHGS